MDCIRLGLPKGSLNTEGRGNTYEVFLDAGYDIEGYTPGKESDKRLLIANDPEIRLFLTRPQSAPVELMRGLLDIAIIGDDWVREESVNSNGNGPIIRVGDLGYGRTRLVMALPKESSYTSLTEFLKDQKTRPNPILCFTEYPHLTRSFVMENPEYLEQFGTCTPLVQVRGIVDGDNQRFQIINSDGVTEGYISKGVDLIVDNTQTGSALREYGLKEIEELARTSAGLYAGPACDTDWKQQKAREIFDMLFGAVQGKKYFDVKFNIPVENLEMAVAYLKANHLCSDEPSVTRGDHFSEVGIVIPREVFPQTVRTLRRDYHASGIIRGEVKQFIDDRSCHP